MLRRGRDSIKSARQIEVLSRKQSQKRAIERRIEGGWERNDLNRGWGAGQGRDRGEEGARAATKREVSWLGELLWVWLFFQKLTLTCIRSAVHNFTQSQLKKIAPSHQAGTVASDLVLTTSRPHTTTPPQHTPNIQV